MDGRSNAVSGGGDSKAVITVTIDQYLTGGTICYTNADGEITAYNTKRTDDSIQAIEGTLIACMTTAGYGWSGNFEPVAQNDYCAAYIASSGLTISFFGGV